MGDIKTIVIASILGLSGFLGLIGALKGLSRGIKRQTVRSLTIVVSAVLSFVAVKILYGAVIGYFENATMLDIFARLESFGLTLDAETKDALSGVNPALFGFVAAIPLALVIGPVVFVPAFIVISAVMWIVHAILSGIFGFRKKKNNKLTRLFGMLLGFVQGVAVSVLLLSPVLGIANTFSGTVETIRSKDNISESEQKIVDFYDVNLKETFDSAPVKFFTEIGGKYIYNSLANIKVGGNNVDMIGEIDTVLFVYTEASNIKSDLTSLTPAEQESIGKIIDAIDSSNYFAPILVNVVNSSTSVLEDAIASDMQEPTKSLVLELLGVFKNATRETVREDFETITDFLFLFINEGVFDVANGPSDPESAEDTDIAKLLLKTDASGKTTIDRAVEILDKNVRTKGLINSLVKLSVVYAKESLLDSFESTGLSDEEVDRIYGEVKGSIEEIAELKSENYESDEAYKNAVASSVEKMAVENGFITELEISENREKMDEVFGEVSEHIIENIGGKEEISDAELVNIIVQYYNSYINKENPAPN